MATFIDFHEEPVVWQDAYHSDAMGVLMKQVITEVREGKVDEFGVRYFNILMAMDGHGCCVSDAPDAQAVVDSHKARGMPIGPAEVHRVVRSLAEVAPIDNVRKVV
ncbi:hypothetical protein [Dactylosporangium sp. CA-092794]|uniref:hypothetical protein n=1 Tax=Dactylosporangium sp. CA-092794 TaxID=3239929 RepID=UPI003D8D16F3